MTKKRRRSKGKGEPSPIEKVRYAAPAEQIPWFTDVEVVSLGSGRVRLRHGPVSASVYSNGDFDLSFNSVAMVSEHMRLDGALSEELQRRYATMPDEAWVEWLRHWAEPPPMISFREGRVVLEWPGGETKPPRRLDTLGLDTTATWDNTYFKGENFRYAHFKTKDGREGAVIQWFEAPGMTSPWVYWGDFAGFMEEQSLYDPGYPEEWREWNDEFGNAFMWALDRMGSFDEPGRLDEMALEAIREDPEALLEDSVKKMLPKLWEYPRELQEAVLDWAFARRMDKDVLKTIEAAAQAAGNPSAAEGIRRIAREIGLEGSAA